MQLSRKSRSDFKTLFSVFSDAARKNSAATAGDKIIEVIRQRMQRFENFQGRRVSKYSSNYQKIKNKSPYKNLGGSLITALSFRDFKDGRGEVCFSGKHRSGKTNREIAAFLLKGKQKRDFFSWRRNSSEHKSLLAKIKTSLLKGGGQFV